MSQTNPTSNERNLPNLLREAERRVNDFVFKQAFPDFARIPADRDHDLDLLLCEAADEIERLTRENAELREGGSRLLTARTRVEERLRAALAHAMEQGGNPHHRVVRCFKCEEARELLSGVSHAPETTACPQAPIVRVVIENGKAAYTTIYAPGLPDGTHDLYCEPEAVAPMMRAEAQTSGECPVCLGERRVTIGRRAIGQDSRIKALQMMYVEQPCPMCNAQNGKGD